MRARYDEVKRLGGEVAAIGTGDVRYAQAFAADESIPFPVLVDDDGRAAEAASVRRATWLGMLHPRTWAATRDTWRRGFRIHRAGKRVTQLGATFVIGPRNGGAPELLYEHLDRDSTDHASLDEVIARLPRR